MIALYVLFFIGFSLVFLIGIFLGKNARALMKRLGKKYGHIFVQLNEGIYTDIPATVKELKDEKGNTYQVLQPKEKIPLQIHYIDEKARNAGSAMLESKNKIAFINGMVNDEFIAFVDQHGYQYDVNKQHKINTLNAYRLLRGKLVELFGASNLIKGLTLLFVVAIIVIAVGIIANYYFMQQTQHQLSQQIQQIQQQVQNITSTLHQLTGKG